MFFEMITVGAAGIFLGCAGMYVLQRRHRAGELKKIAKLTEALLKEREINASASGEETMYGKLEHQLVRVQEMMLGRREAAEKSRDEIQKLISEIAHQMRTPLTNIQTYLGFLREELEEDCLIDKEGTGTYRETADMSGADSLSMKETLILKYVAAIEESEEKLQFLAESFIKMSRLEQHIIQIKKEETDILKTVRNALGQIQSQAEAKEIQFEIVFPEYAVCPHDPNWLGEAVYNILDNAVKYSETGGRVEISVLKNEMFLKIRVRDYGVGIETGEENQVFQRFYRGRRVTTQEGFGIGLYLAREIVNQHGGFLVAKRMHPGVMMEISLSF